MNVNCKNIMVNITTLIVIYILIRYFNCHIQIKRVRNNIPFNKTTQTDIEILKSL